HVRRTPRRGHSHDYLHVLRIWSLQGGNPDFIDQSQINNVDRNLRVIAIFECRKDVFLRNSHANSLAGKRARAQSAWLWQTAKSYACTAKVVPFRKIAQKLSSSAGLVLALG